MNRSFKTGSHLALAVTTAMAGIALASGIGIAANAAPRADQSFASAQTALSKGQVDKAITHAEAAVLADPRNPGYRALLGAAYLGAGRFEAAATSFGDALDLGDTNPRTVLSFALAKIALGQSGAALTMLEQHSDAIDPADLGLALALAGQPERGVHVLVNAVRSAEQATPKLRQNLAYSYALAGNWRAARVMAAEDVPADQIEARLAQWAASAGPENFQQRIANLLGVTPRADSGQPQRLALANSAPSAPAMAEAAVAAEDAPVALAAAAPAAEPAPAPVVQPARAPVTSFAQAFAAPEPAAPQAAPKPAQVAEVSGIRYVSNPVVQELPTRAEGRAPVRVAAAPAPARARSVATPPATPRAKPVAASMPSDKAKASHLIQLGSYDSKIEAERGWSTLKAKFPQLKDHTPVITQAQVNGRTFWRVAAAGFGPKSAQAMCGTVKSAGRGCFAYAASSPPAGAVKSDVKMAARK
jgi:Flp pilus assembly protein TadD